MRDKGAIEPDEAVAVIKVGKSEPVFQGEVGHGCLLKQTSRRKPSANRRDSPAQGATIAPVSLFSSIPAYPFSGDNSDILCRFRSRDPSTTNRRRNRAH
jgi:hypothetical protein